MQGNVVGSGNWIYVKVNYQTAASGAKSDVYNLFSNVKLSMFYLRLPITVPTGFRALSHHE